MGAYFDSDQVNSE